LRKLAVHCHIRRDSIRPFCLWAPSQRYPSMLITGNDVDLPQGFGGDGSCSQNAKSFKTSDPAIKKLGSRSQKSSELQSCYRHGCLNHGPVDCKFRDAQCHSCGKTGHIAPACRLRSSESAHSKIEAKEDPQHSGWHTVF